LLRLPFEFASSQVAQQLQQAAGGGGDSLKIRLLYTRREISHESQQQQTAAKFLLAFRRRQLTLSAKSKIQNRGHQHHHLISCFSALGLCGQTARSSNNRNATTITMDAITGFVIWPFVTVFLYARFVVAVLLNLIPIIYLSCCTKKGLDFANDFFHLHASLSSLPLGRYLFSGLVSFFAPYTANIAGYVSCLDDTNGVAISMSDFPWLRNPFSSIHAIALANLGEYSSGLAMVSALQHHKSLRGIPVGISTVYMKKARGVITGKTSAVKGLASIDKSCEVETTCIMYDVKGEVVAETKVSWSISVKSSNASSSKEKMR